MAAQIDREKDRYRHLAVLQVITILKDMVARNGIINSSKSSKPAPRILSLKRRNGNAPGMYALLNESSVNKKPCIDEKMADTTVQQGGRAVTGRNKENMDTSKASSGARKQQETRQEIAALPDPGRLDE
ncbi:hypothetical protein PQX77_010693 [Marasmius sp. AFHP31]|nr:hypothetical protein PQX77_010693 [Marasmius sp. AFHP31]